MLRGLWQLTWLEIKIFVREPLGLFGTDPASGGGLRRLRPDVRRPCSAGVQRMATFVCIQLPVLASMLICLSAVLSLVTIIAIYREGGILKRLRATPLRPHTILTAHVLVKMLFTRW